MVSNRIILQKIHGIKPLSSLTLSYLLECHDLILLLGKVQLCIKTKIDCAQVVSPGSEVFVGVSASSIFSTDDVRLLTPAARNCRYSYENHLNYFSRYSQSNCLMERMAKSITRQCGCLPFYFLGHFPN